MKKTLILLPFLALLISPAFLTAMTNEETEGRDEIEQGWVDRHNDKLVQPIKDGIKKIRARKNSFLVASRKRHLVHMKRIRAGYAAKNHVPLTQPFPSATPVPLVALYQAKAGGFSFLVADYADDYDVLHSSSDIYIKIGLMYRHVFHGEGYRGCARIMTLGKDSPLFFETSAFGGGAACKRILYTLDLDAIKNLSQDLYYHPESVKPEDYVKQVLEFNVWLNGYTFYKDIDNDGSVEIVNSTQTEYPAELKTKMQEKYHQVDNEFGGPFCKIASFYQWEKTKKKFVNIGDYFYSPH